MLAWTSQAVVWEVHPSSAGTSVKGQGPPGPPRARPETALVQLVPTHIGARVTRVDVSGLGKLRLVKPTCLCRAGWGGGVPPHVSVLQRRDALFKGKLFECGNSPDNPVLKTEINSRKCCSERRHVRVSPYKKGTQRDL